MLGTLAAATAMAVVLRTQVVGSYVVPSSSMCDTLQVGDRLVAERLSRHAGLPAVGSIVTLRDPEHPGRTLVKRVVATQGQVVELRGGKVVVDGLELDEPYVDQKPTYPASGEVSYPYVVPQGCVWVMGDNRVASHDSRYFGAVAVRTLEARVVAIVWPREHARHL